MRVLVVDQGNSNVESIIDLTPLTSPVLMLDCDRKERVFMPEKLNTPEQIINKLRQAEVMLNQGATVAEIRRKIEVTS